MSKATILSCELLEPRLAMAGMSATLTNGVLAITGTQGDDDLTIARWGGRFHIVQTEESFKVGEVDQIEIALGDGDDSIRLKAVGKSLKSFRETTTITAGSGNVEFVGPNRKQKLYFGGDDDLLAISKAGSITINGSAPDWFSKNISDSSLRDVVRAAAIDEVLSRADMLDIFADISPAAVVGRDNFDSLKALVDKKTFFVGLEYVRILSSYVVDGCIPNAHYRGNALGNLDTDSTGSELQLLVNKWFLGLDHPNTHRAGWTDPLTYKRAAGNVFDGAPSYTQVDQGVLGDCYFLSAMTAITTKDPQRIVDMFIDNGDNTWTVQFFDNHKPYFVTIDKMLPVDSQDEFVFTGDEQRYDNVNNVLWAALAEKAYAQFAEFGLLSTDGPKTNAYAALDEGYPNLAMGNILGMNVPSMSMIQNTSSNAMARAFNNGRPVALVTMENPTSAQIVSDHVYAMLGYNASTQKFELFNPWGIANNNSGKPGILHLSFAEMSQNFGYWRRGPVL